MRTTINLDDDLLAQAKTLCGVEDRGALLKEALRALIERESALTPARHITSADPRCQRRQGSESSRSHPDWGQVISGIYRPAAANDHLSNHGIGLSDSNTEPPYLQKLCTPR